MRTHWWTKASALLLTGAALALGSPSALAQPITTPGVEASKQADELFRKGKDLYKAGQVREAYQSYRAAWDLKQSYDIAANLANTEMVLGMKRDAAEHFAACLFTFAATGSKPQQEAVKKQFEEARKEIGAIAIKVNVDGAEVLIDGKSVGRAPLRIEAFVEPGARTVEARLSGYEPVKQSVQVAKGAATMKISLTLSEVKPPPEPAIKPPEPGASGKPGAGENGTGEPGSGAPQPTVGPRPDRPKGAGEIEPSIVYIRPNRKVLIVGGAVAGVALVGGIVFTALANSKADAANEKRDTLKDAGGPGACIVDKFKADCDSLHDLRQSASTFTNVAGWAFIGAGVVAAGTLIYTLASPRKTVVPAMQASPVVTGNGGGLLLSGRW